MDNSAYKRQCLVNPLLDNSLSSQQRVETRFAEYLQPTSANGQSNRSRTFRVAMQRAIKKARKIVKRNLTPVEIEMLENEVAKYA